MTPDLAANVDYATRPMSDSERRDAMLRFARVAADLTLGSIEAPFYLGYARAISPLPAEEVEPLFEELVDAAKDLEEWSQAADAGLGYRWALDHGLSASDRGIGTRLASTVESLLSRLVGGVAS